MSRRKACTPECWAPVDCLRCGKRKRPVGRSAPLAMAGIPCSVTLGVLVRQREYIRALETVVVVAQEYSMPGKLAKAIRQAEAAR